MNWTRHRIRGRGELTSRMIDLGSAGPYERDVADLAALRRSTAEKSFACDALPASDRVFDGPDPVGPRRVRG